MADNLSNFRDRCCYCFMGVRDGLCRCTCGLSLCSSHRSMHTGKFGCGVLFDVNTDENGKLAVENLSLAASSLFSGDAASPDALAQRLASIAKQGGSEPDDRMECPHISGASPVEASLGRPRCSTCGLEENLWMCLGCGNIGCGREQPSRKGCGHALAHFQGGPEGHGQAVYVSSIGEDSAPDTYCYHCDAFVYNPHHLRIEYNNSNVKRFRDSDREHSSAEEDAPVARKDAHFVGIRNAGQTCYISSVLQMLGDLYQDYEPDAHFLLCEANPLECLGCQFAKIMAALRQQKCGKHAAPAVIPLDLEYLDIGDFLRLIFREMPQYSKGQQQDSA